MLIFWRENISGNYLKIFLVYLQAEFQLVKADAGINTSKVSIQITCETGDVTCNVAWSNKTATCSFVPTCTGEHKVYSESVILKCYNPILY